MNRHGSQCQQMSFENYELYRFYSLAALPPPHFEADFDAPVHPLENPLEICFLFPHLLMSCWYVAAMH
jgi:hypothetical protein